MLIFSLRYFCIKYLRGRQAQVISEYVITFFLIVAVISAMSVFVKRALQGRIYEARNTMIRMVNLEITNLEIPLEYEPYYVETRAELNRDSTENAMLLGGEASGVAVRGFIEKTQAQTNSMQLPPKDAR